MLGKREQCPLRTTLPGIFIEQNPPHREVEEAATRCPVHSDSQVILGPSGPAPSADQKQDCGSRTFHCIELGPPLKHLFATQHCRFASLCCGEHRRLRAVVRMVAGRTAEE